MEHELLSAGFPPISTCGDPGTHIGGAKAGEHGAVAPTAFAATAAGFIGELHIPKVPFGTSIIFKAGLFSARILASVDTNGKGFAP
jgi:hypothetical protein